LLAQELLIEHKCFEVVIVASFYALSNESGDVQVVKLYFAIEKVYLIGRLDHTVLWVLIRANKLDTLVLKAERCQKILISWFCKNTLDERRKVLLHKL